MSWNIFYQNDLDRQKLQADLDKLLDAIAIREQAILINETLPENNDDIMSSETEEI